MGSNVLKMATATAVMAVAFASVASARATTDAQVESAATPSGEGDIIVTAQKRSERLQDVPISVAAFSGAQLSEHGIVSSRDLTQVAPGLVVTETNSYVQPFIRGIGSTTLIPGEAGSVATYVDGVYMPIANASIFELANIETVEVLKGPQGTLYGRNALGGAININTKAPKFTPEGSFEVGYGNFDAATVRAYATGPLSDNVAISIAGNFRHRGGYFNDLFRGRKVDDGNSYSYRGKLLINASDRLKLTLSGDYSLLDDPISVLQRPINGYLGRTATSLYPQEPFDYVGDVKPSLRVRNRGASARADYALDTVNLVSITAYRAFDAVSSIESDSTPNAISGFVSNERGHTFSQEVQIVSDNSGPFSWILGGYYADQVAGYRPLTVNGATVISAPVDAKIHAAFADGTYKLGDFELTGGVRYNREKKSYSATLNGVAVVNNASKSWESITPRAILTYHPNRDFLAYVSYTAGFKSGAFNTSSFATTALDPEKTDAYEVGVKLSSGRMLTVNASAFWYDSRDVQVQTISGATNLPALANAAKVRSKGADLDLTLRPVDGLYLRAGVAYLDAKLKSFPNAQIFVPAAPGVAPALPDSTGNLSLSRDVSGNPMVRSPKWTFNLAASYTIELPGGGSIVPSANLFHSSEFSWEFGNRLKQSSYTLVNAELNWHLAGDQVTVGIWGKNLGDKVYYLSVTPNRFADRAISAEPRTYGIKVGFKY
nr:TonB-dependent receptor [Sphingomonas sp. CDS-1]